MASLQDMLNTVEAKFKLLHMTDKATDRVLQTSRIRDVNKHLSVFESRLNELHDLKANIQEAKLSAAEGDDDVEAWGTEFDERTNIYEDVVDKLTGAMNSIKHAAENTNQGDEGERKQILQKNEVKPQVKLPKLTITKFNGTHVDWFRFYNQFTVEIGNTDIPSVSKFSYLKEMINTNVRQLIDGLPFTTEGYERAKVILETKYGRTSEIVNAHVEGIMALPTIQGQNSKRIHEFFVKLVQHVQALETMGKLKSIDGYLRLILNRLPGIRADLVRDDSRWQEWTFANLVESLRKWTDRNPICKEEGFRETRRDKPDKSFSTMGEDQKCIYCDGTSHKSGSCTVVADVENRKQVIKTKRLCYNCTGAKHRASECRSKRGCGQCGARHHTSICDREKKPHTNASSCVTTTPSPMLLTPHSGVIYPVAIAHVNGIKCRVFIDTGTGNRYGSAVLIASTNAEFKGTVQREVAMLLHTTNVNFDVYGMKLTNVKGDFEMNIEVTKVKKNTLLNIDNPHYEDVINQYQHLSGIHMDDIDTKEQLPIHLVLGSGDYARIKTATKPRIGKPGEPVAEYTKLGWVIFSPGMTKEKDVSYLTKSVTEDYDRLCSLDVLGIADNHEGDQQLVHEEFKQQLSQTDDGRYETSLMWKPGHPELPSNEAGSRGRLANLLKRLNREPEKLQAYHDIIQQQLEEGIVEKVEQINENNQFFIPHKMVTKEDAETTKHRVVFDASARANERSPSLNDCLETGPPLQNLLWNILVRSRLKPIAIAGDLKQAFLQVKIRETDRSVLQFHWIKDVHTQEVEVLRFTRALFGLVQSPFLLGGTIEHHLSVFKELYPDIVEEIKKSIYVDDIIHGVSTVIEAQRFKEASIEIFKNAGFVLHKWHSNEPTLEDPIVDDGESTYAKQKFGDGRRTKMLGLHWDKVNDTLSVAMPQTATASTKRGVLQYLASIYDPLGFISAVTLHGKCIFRDICEAKFAWDTPIEGELLGRWEAFKESLPVTASIPRALMSHRQDVTYMDLHSFGDASKKGTAAAVYAVVYQPSGVSQGLIASKARLSKKTTIPRLELIAAHMAANLLRNIRQVLPDIPIRKEVAWSDSTVVLHWIRTQGNHYKQFVKNQVRKISETGISNWRHVPGIENPVDVASRGTTFDKLDKKWWNGPVWLNNEDNWPDDVQTSVTKETEEEARLTKEILAVAIPITDAVHELVSRFPYKKTMRITGWIKRFTKNCQLVGEQKIAGPLTTDELQEATESWVRQTQLDGEKSANFVKHQSQLNLKKDNEGIYRCYGRILGMYPVYLPTESTFTEKLVMSAHCATLHGGVGLTMARVREDYWVPRLRQLIKRLRHGCHGCKRYHTQPLAAPLPGNLPEDRTKGERPFQVIGLDYAGPFYYRKGVNAVGKGYILLYTCSLTRAICLEFVADQSLETFITSLKRLMARRGRPEKIYSDNFKTFIAASKWIKRAVRNDAVHDFLSSQGIRWQFNLSRAPWWGGQFERMVGLTKQALYKAIGRATLKWNEFVDVLLDVELTLNNRPLSYVDDDVEMPILTPNVMMFGQPHHVPDQDEAELDGDLRKRARFLQQSKKSIWKRWSDEYLRGLRERHNMTHKGKDNTLSTGDVVIIKGEDRNRAKWKIGIVEEVITGRDGVVRGARLRAGKNKMERAVQHLYPLEMSCDRESTMEPTAASATADELNAAAEEFLPRRNAAAVAAIRINDQEGSDDNGPEVE